MATSARLIGRMRAGLLMLGAALLVAAWIPATVPYGAPDEVAHYLHALNIANGQILGVQIPFITSEPVTAQQTAWASRNNRAVLVPARMDPPNVPCWDGKPNLRGSCIEQTDSGNYPPLSYLLPAVALKVSTDSSTGLWLGRAATALPSVALLVLAVALLWGGTGWSLLGFLAATSPMVLWDSAILNPSGVQIAACLAFVAALIRILRAPPDAPTWTWVALAISGVVAMNAGGIGLEFVILDLIVFGALFGLRGVRGLRGISDRWTVRGSVLALIAGALAALIYSRAAGFSAEFRISPLLPGLHQGWIALPGVMKGAVGIFGALTVFLPTPAYWVWWLTVLGLVAAALWLGERRERLVVASVTIFAVAFPILFEAWVDRLTGFWLQGREVLPVLMLTPLVAGEVVYRHRARFVQRRWAAPALGAAIALFAGFQAYAWWWDARTVVGAPNTIRFWDHAVWTPPGGWMPWVVCAALGTVALFAYASTEGFRGIRLPTTRPAGRRERVVG